MDEPFRLLTTSPEQTGNLGRTIGELAQPGDVYLLTGPLGAGKTCLTQGIARGLGIEGYVRSPTFVLMTRHTGGRLTLHHVDLYRVGGPEEAWDLGLDELLSGDGVCVIEWADRAEEVFPEDALWLELDYGSGVDDRTITVDAISGRYRALAQVLAAAAGNLPEARR
jgi:tRNA threonylcarbamoyladenosine biosynthesis protein TsaE